MADLLERMINQQGQDQANNAGNPRNNMSNQEGEDRVLEWFQKFAPPKFIGGPNPDLAEGCWTACWIYLLRLGIQMSGRYLLLFFSLRGRPSLVVCD